jgi:adenosylhomocysteine nucleosidase
MKKSNNSTEPKIVILISANIEWRAVRNLFPDVVIETSPFGEWFLTYTKIKLGDNSGPSSIPVVFFHGGWGKISAAASTQYVIDKYSPGLLVNLGTCGGFEGEIERGTILLAEKTVVYDIIEQMYDYNDHIGHYTTNINLSWLESDYPLEVYRTLIVSGDKDLAAEDIKNLKSKYRAVAGDWESGAIAHTASLNKTRLLILRGVSDLVGENGGVAHTASLNKTRLLILRGVSDLVGENGGEAYGNAKVFEENTSKIMGKLVESLPRWIMISNVY